MTLTERVKQFVIDEGADMVGIAPVSRFNDAPRGHHPTSFVAASRSLIVFGIALNEYIVNWHDLLTESELISPENQPLVAGPHFYGRCAYEVVNHRLEQIGLLLSNQFRREGHRSIYFPATWAHHVQYMAQVPGFYAPFSFRHAAVRAGLGEFGWQGLVVTKDYGPRVRFMAVSTSARLEPDPLVSEPICTDCHTCIRSCPAAAFIEPESRSVTEDRPIRLNTPVSFEKAACYTKGIPLEETQDNQIVRPGICRGTCINVCPVGKTIN